MAADRPPWSRTAGAVRPGAVTAVVCLALAAVVAAISSLNVALPGIAAATHAGQTQLAWIIDAYSLAFAALLLPAGAIGDRFGRRRALIAGLSVFGAGSAVAMTARSATELIGLRAVLGLGAALVMPATLSTITGTFASEQRTRAVSVWAAVAGGAAVLGLLASGIVLGVWSWPAVFGLNVILAAAALAGTARLVPESADPASPRLDAGGAGLSVLGMVALVFSIIEAPGQGWASARTVAGLAAGIAVLAGFIWWERRRPGNRAPMLDPRVFAHRGLAAGSLSIFVQFFALFGFIFIVLQYLQLIRGDSGLVSAASMLPLSAAMLPTARLAPGADGPAGRPHRLRRRARAHRRGAGGPRAADRLQRLLAGGHRADPAGRRDGPGHDPRHQRHHLDLAHLPAAQAARARSSVAVAARLSGAAGQAHTAFTAGLHLALLVGAGIVVTAAVAVAVLLRGHGRP